jgi:DNA-binding transcriptional LysR family regulator
MELRHLRYFVVVAQELHFGRAAKRLNMAQPPLSRQIKELEEELGFPLFVREYHKVQLTNAGKVYLSRVKRIIEKLGAAKQDALDVAAGHKGRLRIGCSTHLSHVYLPRFLAAFRREAPGIAIDLTEAPSPKLVQALREKTADLAFPMMPIEAAGMIVEDFLSEPLVIVLPQNHPYAYHERVSLDLLAKENFILCRRYAEDGFHEIGIQLCKDAGFFPSVLHTAERKQTVVDLVAQGMGVSVTPTSAMELRSDRVCFRSFEGSKPYLRTAAVWRKGKRAALAESFVAIAKRELLELKQSKDIRIEYEGEKPNRALPDLSTVTDASMKTDAFPYSVKSG